jgi:hypothetical protein
MRLHSDTIPNDSRDRLVLLVLPSAREGSFTLYDDDRESYRYEKGESSRQTFTVSRLKNSQPFSLQIGAVEGAHTGMKTERSYRIEVPSSLASPSRVTVAGAELRVADAGEASPPAPHWQKHADRLVVELGPTKGPVTVEFA